MTHNHVRQQINLKQAYHVHKIRWLPSECLTHDGLHCDLFGDCRQEGPPSSSSPLLIGFYLPTTASITARSALLGTSSLLAGSGSRVIGLLLWFRSHAMIWVRSYVNPSVSITGSSIVSCLQQHEHGNQCFPSSSAKETETSGSGSTDT